ncbi:hypothetical protein A0J51_00417 [Gluconobacter japonicus]|nr:hypothetical protein A0J51_00417 [Gluconobacter japonicus]
MKLGPCCWIVRQQWNNALYWKEKYEALVAIFYDDTHFFSAWDKRQPAEILHDRRERLQQLSLLGMGRDRCSLPMGNARFQKNVAKSLSPLNTRKKLDHTNSPAITALMALESVPATTARTASFATSVRRRGSALPNAPIRIPIVEILANPHNAKDRIVMVL